MFQRYKRLKMAALVLLLLVLTVWASNTSLFTNPLPGEAYLVAHRALGQGFSREGLTGKTCTASRMLPSEHPYLENTLPAMRAAFDYGASMVEFDVHRTTDDRFAVFHDWTVDCRTEGTGQTRDHSLVELQQLDVGYGYTADGGKSWPFRGQGVGLMPSLEQVLTTFPDRDFLIDIKSNDASEGELLAERLAQIQSGRSGAIALTGGPQPVARVSAAHPELRTITRPQLKQCLSRYLAYGWTTAVPKACHNRLLMVPANVAPWLWGWPHRFQRRMHGVNSRVVLIGDYTGQSFSTGFDDPERFRRLPADYSGGVFTDRIDLVGPVAKNR